MKETTKNRLDEFRSKISDMSPDRFEEFIDKLNTLIGADVTTFLGQPHEYRATIQLHALFCASSHEPGECEFYIENAMDSPWNMTAHSFWRDQVKKSIKRFGYNTAGELSSDIEYLGTILPTLIGKEPLTKLLVAVLTNDLFKLLPEPVTSDSLDDPESVE